MPRPRTPCALAPPPAPAAEAMLCFNLYAASHAFTRFYKPLLDPLGLTYPQYLVLLSLGRQDGQGVGQLSDELHLDTNTLSPLLKRLEGVGLIRRSRLTADERRVAVHLTERGRTVAAEAARIPQAVAGSLEFAGDELTQCNDTLRRLRRALDPPLRE